MDDHPSWTSAFDGDASALAAAVARAVTPQPAQPLPAASLPMQLPVEGIGSQAALDVLAGRALTTRDLLRDADSTARMGSPTPWITWVGAAWAASRSENLLDVDASSQAVELHDRLMQWLAPVWGMKSGHIVPGSTIANLSAIWVARDAVGVSRIVASEACHESLAKVSRVLAMPLVTLPVDENEMLDVGALVDFARRDPDGMSRTVVVLTAGTHAAGAIDPLHDAPKRLRRLGLNPPWWHVDASWAGPLAFSSKMKNLLRGVESADSVSVAAHKMMFTPADTSFVLFKDPVKADQVLEFSGLGGSSQLGLMGSRSDRALPLAMLLLAYGSRGLAEWIESGSAAIGAVAQALFERDDVEVFAAPHTGVLLWRPVSRDVEDVAATLGAQRARTVFAAGHRWIRNVVANPLTDPADLLASIEAALA